MFFILIKSENFIFTHSILRHCVKPPALKLNQACKHYQNRCCVTVMTNDVTFTNHICCMTSRYGYCAVQSWNYKLSDSFPAVFVVIVLLDRRYVLVFPNSSENVQNFFADRSLQVSLSENEKGRDLGLDYL